MARRTPTRRTGWSIPVSRVFGIPVRLHVSFLLLPAFVVLAAWSHGQPATPALGFLALVVLCILLHELGHAWAAARTGIRADRVTLYPTGGIAWFDQIPTPKVEWQIAIAGPLVNLAIASIVGTTLLAARGPAGLTLSATAQATGWGLAAAMLWINLSIAAFNLVPAYPMDGGRILRALLTLRWSQRRATRLSAIIGMLLAVGLAAYGWISRDAWLAVLSMVVFVGAVTQSRAEYAAQWSLERWTSEAMVTRFVSIEPDAGIAEAAFRAAATAQHEFPVIDRDGNLLGVVTGPALYHALEFSGPSGCVRDVAVTDVPHVAPGDDLNGVLTLARHSSGLPILVVEDGCVVGMIPANRVREYAEIESRRVGERPGRAIA